MLGAFVHWALTYADIYSAQEAMVWLTGSLNTVSWTDILRMLGADVVLPLADGWVQAGATTPTATASIWWSIRSAAKPSTTPCGCWRRKAGYW